MRQPRIMLATCLLLGLAGSSWAATPPELLNYQGVLRDASDNPLDGSHDMVFRFYDAAGDASCVGGTLLLTDAHEAAGTGAVQVSGGLFNVELGGGTLTPGTASTLAEVFRDHAAVWLEPTVGGEQLCPRIRVRSAGFALNASHLDGLGAGNASGQIPVSNGTRNSNLNADMLDGYSSNSFGKRTSNNTWAGANDFSNVGNVFVGDGSGLTGITADLLDGLDSTQFLNTSSTAQTKTGTLTVDVTGGGMIPGISAISDYYGVDAQGNSAGGYFRSGTGSGYAYLGSGGTGVSGHGNGAGGSFSDLDSGSQAYVAFGDYGIEAKGNTAGGYFYDGNDMGWAYLGYGNTGIEAYGNQAGGLFVDYDDTGQATLASGDTGIAAWGAFQAGIFTQTGGSGEARVAYSEMGIEAKGSTAGGYFYDSDSDSTGYAYVGKGDVGVYGGGSTMGGSFEDTDGSGQAQLGTGDAGVVAYGNAYGGYFDDTDASGKAFVAYGDIGIQGEGTEAGGYFRDSDHSGIAYAGYGNTGIHAEGIFAGGYFKNLTSSSYAYVGYTDRGIHAEGSLAGGYFRNSTGSSYAYLGNYDRGIFAEGNEKGAYFRSIDDAGIVSLGYSSPTGGRGVEASGTEAGGVFSHHYDSGLAYLGHGHRGIEAEGSEVAGYFEETDSNAKTWVAWKDAGIEAWGHWVGGLFKDSGASGLAYVGYGDYGGSFFGDYAGVRGQDNDSGVYGILAFNVSSTLGTGAKNFIQNHPYRDDAIIVYAAAEGNEVATYTRGTARLVGGEARIALDETFAWVTNPDIGLTAHLTPRTEGASLFAAELTTGELVVRGDPGSADDAVFDYMVWGLRVGFEEVSVVREKGPDEAYIPSMRGERERHLKHPEWRKHVPLERFGAMRASLGVDSPLDLSAAEALRDAIGEFDPAIHGTAEPPSRPPEHTETADVQPSEVRPEVAVTSEDTVNHVPPATVGEEPIEDEIAPSFPLLPVQGPVAVGDLLAVTESGELAAVIREADPGVVGVVAGESIEVDGQTLAPVATFDVVALKVDADLGAVRPGDLLVSSPTPGHAMRAYADLPGTVIAKALEPLEDGRATIRVLVMPR